jgi:glycosyltransferase involved in cell wall biosynthesis
MTCVILLATKNGEKFLAKQLDSIKEQSYKDWIVYASDDGSSDCTLDILLRYQKQWGKTKLSIYQGPKQGFAKNFWSLIHRVKRKDTQYIAFCDQDDVWDPEHVKRAISSIRFNKTPCLFGSRTQYINQDDHLLDFSPEFLKDPCFQNALVQNIAGGNTQVFNAALLPLLQKIPLGSPIVSHDWMVYLVTTAIGGKVFYSLHPTVLYRQHTMNLVGRNDSFFDQLKRFWFLLQGRFRQWNTYNLQCLEFISSDMTRFNQEVLRRFTKYRDQHFVFRFIKVFRLYLFRQTLKGQLGLYLGYLLKKI